MARTIAVFIEVSEAEFGSIVTHDVEENSGFYFVDNGDEDGSGDGMSKLRVVSVIDPTGKPIDRTW